MLGFRIKICGITQPSDAVTAVAAGADAIGLNFSRHSKRCVSADSTAREIVAAAREINPAIRVVGVFVEQCLAQACEIAANVGLDVIQLHGDHSPTEFLTAPSTANCPILWVIRVPNQSPNEFAGSVSEQVQKVPANQIERPGCLSGVLVDAFSGTEFGGTGKIVAWEPLGQRDRWAELGWAAAWPQKLPLVLAGGLTVENVAAAIQLARPDAVDVASGVETKPGVKSAALIKEFVRLAKTAFQT